MALKLYVPTLDDADKANYIRETILTSEPDAKIDTDLSTRVITIEAKASDETFKQLIEATGHQVVPR
ncbi:MAG TPA: heavy metal transport/detoxification protein [Leptolyngbyaceae cyanobacterium M33_DOE_097]|nr:heavy metal transport/detoxification protein [Leptolyngbyaceae cyanobacterium M33_DOE_097]